MQQAKTDKKYGITYAILRNQNNEINASIDSDKHINTFATWEAAEKWVERILEETRVNRKPIKCFYTNSKLQN